MKLKNFFKGAEGKYADLTIYQSHGETIARQVVTPHNPRTDAQTLQRVLMMVVSKVYILLKMICNHSFENYSTGFECMNIFKKVNLKYLRERAATLQQSGQSLSQFYQFSPLQSDKCTPFAAIISQGHLPEISVGIDAAGGHVAYVNSPGRTYADFVNAWGLQRGDQASFVTVQKQDGKYEANFARIILNPRKSDGSGAPMTTEIVNSQGEFPYSNWKNKLYFSRFDFDTDHFNFVLGHGGIVVAAGIIVSRKDKSGGWLRSNCQLVLNEAGFGSDLCSLAEAVEKSYAVADVDMESEFYLNNAGVGGTQGSSSSQGGMTPVTEPVYNSNVSINGVSQNVSGGSVNVDAPLNSIVISGMNLEDANCYATKNNGAQIQPVKAAASLTFSGLGAQAGDVVRVYKEGALWFTVTAQEAQGGGGEGGDTGSVNITQVCGVSATNGGTANIKDNDAITIVGTGFGTDSSTWRMTKGASEEAPTSVTDTQIQFAALSIGTWTLEYNGTGVFTFVVTSAED